MIGIYKFTNKITGESYIGQSVNLKRRYNDHKNIKNDGSYFHRMLSHYGFSNFEYEILEECSKNNLNEREKFYISKYNTVYPHGYNLTEGGNEQHCNGLSSKNDIDEIINLLKTSSLSNIEIGNIYGVSDQSISDINCGRTWHKDDIDYPIRKRMQNTGRKRMQNTGKTYNAMFCIKCGSPIYKYNKTNLCRSCVRKDVYLKANKTPIKEELYNLLCENSFLKVATMYGVTDNAVRKWCDKFKIPRHSSYYRNLKTA